MKYMGEDIITDNSNGIPKLIRVGARRTIDAKIVNSVTMPDHNVTPVASVKSRTLGFDQFIPKVLALSLN